MLGEAEEARLGVAGLGFGGDGADLDEPEAGGEQGRDAFGVFVEAGGEAEWAGEVAAEYAQRSLLPPIFTPLPL